MVYYQAIFKRECYLNLGGIDERFAETGIGSEDNHFLDYWKKVYGMGTFIPLVYSPAVHLWHGGMASGPQGVPAKYYSWVNKNALLRQQLKDIKPNKGKEWGRIYNHLKLTSWKAGYKEFSEVPVSEVRKDVVIVNID
jgi:hypothetical protein